MEISEFMADPKSAAEGVWIQYPKKDCRFKLAYRGSIKFENAQAKLAFEVGKKAAESNGSLDSDSLNANIEAVVDYILLGWEGLLLHGEEFAYSKENARKLLSWSQPIRDWIWVETGKVSNFQVEDAAIAATKSESALDAGQGGRARVSAEPATSR